MTGVDVIGAVTMGGLVATGLTMTIVRIVRSTKPREKQMARLAAELDGRNQVYLRMIENGLAEQDLAWVAGTRGYSVIVHRSFKCYEFVYTPHQPGRIA
ncbi:hypothetical protein ACIRSS_19435 [Amycolatopsis sp. NPDC101161]|uniref:hypothetical protein n=1 Tax=Amycolatopsis sp. NPDC101161 TaxID=3363940 RepID=UPI0037F1555C